MLISVCIPQFNRVRYLLAVLESIRIQSYPQVEVIISDDCSTDDTQELIPKYIADVEGTTHVRFQYIRQQKNLGYDGNLRAALAGGEGEYLFALGNDDALPDKDSLAKLAVVLKELHYPDVCFTNFHSADEPHNIQRRARSTAILGSGPDVAVKNYRSFSFVGGFVIKKTEFAKHNTAQYDGSVYVQIYLGARVTAAGGSMAAISDSLVAKDVRFPGQEINSYLDTLAVQNRRLHAEFGGLDEVGRVACEAILPYVQSSARQHYISKIYSQLILLTYSYWLLNYRKNGVYRAAVNLAIGCFPPRLVKVPGVSPFVYLYLMILHAGATAVGLLLPIGLLGKVAGLMSSVSKRSQLKVGSIRTGSEVQTS